MHPIKYQENKQLLDYCHGEEIKIEAYSPLTHGVKLQYEKFKEVAENYKKSVPQILLRWSLQHGFICLPRSSNKQHIIENSQIFDFELSEKDINKLNSI